MVYKPDLITGDKTRVALSYESKLLFLEDAGYDVNKSKPYVGTGGMPTYEYILRNIDNFRVFSIWWGTRGGKSRLAASNGAANMALLPRYTGKPQRHWIVGPNYYLAEKEFRYYKDCFVRAKIPMAHCTHNPKGQCRIVLENGSILETKSAEHVAQKGLLGEEVDYIIYSEWAQCPNAQKVFELYCWERGETRLAQHIIPTTPHGYGFCYDTLYQRGLSDDIKYRSWGCVGPYPSSIGAGMTEDDEMYARLIMSDEVWREQYGGEFVPKGGRVFKEFKRNLNVYTDKGEQKLLRSQNYGAHDIYIGVDWGARSESAIVFAAKINDVHFVFDEIYRSHLEVHQIADLFKEKCKQHKIDYTNRQQVKIYADHAWHLQKWMKREHGIKMKNARKEDMHKSIWYVRELLHLHPKLKMPRLMIHDRCKSTIDEFEQYAYDEDYDQEKNPTEKPIDKYNHAMDAIRYLTFTPRKDLWDPDEVEHVK